MPCTARIGDDLDLDLLLVCAGGNPAQFAHRSTFAWLRRLAQRGLRIGGVSGGPFILARAGIMGGYRMTIHWEHAPAFAEEFPDLLLTRARYVIEARYVIDRSLATASWLRIVAFDVARVMLALKVWVIPLVASATPPPTSMPNGSCPAALVLMVIVLPLIV